MAFATCKEQGPIQSFPHPRVAWCCGHLKKKSFYIFKRWHDQKTNSGLSILLHLWLEPAPYHWLPKAPYILSIFAKWGPREEIMQRVSLQMSGPVLQSSCQLFYWSKWNCSYKKHARGSGVKLRDRPGITKFFLKSCKVLFKMLHHCHKLSQLNSTVYCMAFLVLISFRNLKPHLFLKKSKTTLVKF